MENLPLSPSLERAAKPPRLPVKPSMVRPFES
jgi:hypothetical protein